MVNTLFLNPTKPLTTKEVNIGDILTDVHGCNWIVTNFVQRTYHGEWQLFDGQIRPFEIAAQGIAFTRLGDVNRDKHRIKTVELYTPPQFRNLFPQLVEDET